MSQAIPLISVWQSRNLTSRDNLKVKEKKLLGLHEIAMESLLFARSKCTAHNCNNPYISPGEQSKYHLLRTAPGYWRPTDMFPVRFVFSLS